MSTETKSMVEIENEFFHRNTYCDGCGARAVYRIIFTFGQLDFCRHHFRKHEFKLCCESLKVLTHETEEEANSA